MAEDGLKIPINGGLREQSQEKAQGQGRAQSGVSLGRRGLTSSEMGEGKGAKCTESRRSCVRQAWLCSVLAV